MECQICSRDRSIVSGLICPGCTRTILFPLRLQQAQILLEKERLGHQVETIADYDAAASQPTEHPHPSTEQIVGAKALSYDKTLATLSEVRERIDTIAQHAATLKADMKSLKANLQNRRVDIQKQKDQLQQEKKSLDVQRTTRASLLQKAIEDRALRSDAQYKDIVGARIQKCKLAISLAGLKQIVKPRDCGKKTPQYCVWNLLVPDIRQLNNAEAAHISTVLAHIARLIYQVSTYLHVRLPAEIILAHNDWPAPTIFTPASSHSGREVQFPKPTSGSSREGSVKASRETEQRTAGRPRPLSIDRKLPKLAKENPHTYAMFVEGVALLAWDIAWLCRVQGLPVAERDWDDVCDMGRNLWLLSANVPDARPMLQKPRSPKGAIATIKQAEGIKAFATPLVPAALGVASHGSAMYFLEGPTVSAVGMSEVSPKEWAFAFPIKIIDELKAALLTDMSGYDWELLDDRDDELADGTDAEETVVIDKTKPSSSNAALVRNENGEDKKGTSGWTKLKSRNPS